MPEKDSVTTWITRLRAGDDGAAQQLWERYFDLLVKVARQKLGATPRKVNDEEDVALSAFHSFCLAVEKGRFPQLSSRDDLWQLLLMHTARKVVDQKRHQTRHKRGGEAIHVQDDSALQKIIGNEPDPQFALEVADQFELLMSQLKTDELRLIALRKMEGCTNEEIAEELDYSVSTVRRKTSLIKRRWEEFAPSKENY